MLISMLQRLIHGFNRRKKKNIGEWSLISPLKNTAIFIATHVYKEILINGYN